MLPWVCYDISMSALPQARWLAARQTSGISCVTMNDAEAIMCAVAAGFGRSLLPCAIADRNLRRRAKTTASSWRSRRYGIVPLRMECITRDVEGLHLRVADLDALRVAARIQLAAHGQASRGRGGGNQFDHCFATGQGLASPGLSDVAEQPVLDLVPLQRAWGVMADLKRQAGFVSQVLQFNLEQAHA